MNVYQKILGLFFIYSFLGWVVEVVYVSIHNKKWCDRGFLIGPICPIYGMAAMGLTMLLDSQKDNYLLVFMLAIVICTIVEYYTSVVMEKMFNRRWWDYSQFRFNINGRVCVKNSIEFGILGTLAVTVISPFLCKIMNISTLNIILAICTIIFIVDIIFSVIIMHKIKVQTQNIHTNIKQDDTEEINREIKKYVLDQSFLYKRVFRTFPGFKIQDKIKKITSKVSKKRKK